MPTGYAGEGKTFSRKQGKWITKEKEKAFEYDALDPDSGGFIISVFRWYPDLFADMCRSPNAQYTLELPQRLMMRIDARYRNDYITGCRGLTKTYQKLLGKMIKGILFPGEKMRYNAPNQKQAAALATQAFHQIEKDYPLIAAHWDLRNDRADMFRITTRYGSEFTMYAPRGDNSSETIAEEIGQEGADPFDMDSYEQDVLPTCRLERTVNQKPDPYHINLQHSHISNACSKQNRAFSVHRAGVLKDMLYGEEFEGYVIDFSWVTALMGNLRSISYIKDLRGKLTANQWKREMCAQYTGDSESPMISDEKLSIAKRNPLMEFSHCGDTDVIYIVSHDVSYKDSAKNAKCADVVLKLTRFDDVERRDKYLKQVVWIDNYPPPKTAYEQAMKLKKLWQRYSIPGSIAYLLVDTQAYGTSVVEELMKPTPDNSRPLCCYNHMAFTDIEQPNAIPVIYPMKATPSGGADPDTAMIEYAQLEFEQETIELLIPNVLDGVEAYKRANHIKDARHDAMISLPYKQCDLLCQQIDNLQTDSSGREKRKSKTIQRDIWSALKYALRLAQHLEKAGTKEKYSQKSSWKSKIEPYQKMAESATAKLMGSERGNVLSMRKW